MSLDSQKAPPAVEFKSSTFSVPVLLLASADLAFIEQQLHEKIRPAPEFFKNSPVIVDLHDLNKQHLTLDLEALLALMRQCDLLPIGLRGGNEAQNRVALSLGIPIHSANGQPVTDSLKVKPSTTAVSDAANKNLLITQPIRSGQRIYSEGDLVVLAQVSAGAEILAEGNIHVYGGLRGRALAGVQGDTQARIFCSVLQAELISIAGNYKVNEDLRDVPTKPVQVYLQDHALIIKAI